MMKDRLIAVAALAALALGAYATYEIIKRTIGLSMARAAIMGSVDIPVDGDPAEDDCVVEMVITPQGTRFCYVCYNGITRWTAFCF